MCYTDVMGWITVLLLVGGIVLFQLRATLTMLDECDANVISEEVIPMNNSFIVVTVKKPREGGTNEN